MKLTEVTEKMEQALANHDDGYEIWQFPESGGANRLSGAGVLYYRNKIDAIDMIEKLFIEYGSVPVIALVHNSKIIEAYKPK